MRGIVDRSVLEAYVFPIEEPEVEEKEEADGPAVEVEEAGANEEDGHLPPIHPSAPRRLVPAAIQPYMRRRDAVVSEGVPADPTYWYSSARFISPKTPEEEEAIAHQLLDTHPVFACYPSFVKKLFQEAFEVHKYNQEETVAEPEEDDAFCYVLHGSVELVPQAQLAARRQNPRGQRTKVKCRQGEDFGRDGLLHILRGPRFSYTAIALLPSSIVRLRRTVYKKIMMVHYLEKHDFLEHTIKYVRVFDGFTNEEKSRIARALEPVTFKKGEVVLRVGESAEMLYILQEGCVEVTKPLSTGLHAQVKLLVPSECVGDAEIFSHDHKSQYDYTAYDEEVRALRLSEDFIYQFHGNPMLKHLFGKINKREVQGRRILIEEIRRKDEYSVFDLSVSEPDLAEMGLEGGRKQKRLSEARTGSSAGCSSEMVSTQPGALIPVEEDEDDEEEDDTLDSDDEERYITPVTMKSEQQTNFLLERFFTRRAYNRCSGRDRGIALTVFTSPRPLVCGTVLFSAEPATLPHESEAVVRARRLRRRKDKPAFDNNEQFLYVVYKGTIELKDRGGDRIATITAGGSVGEHRLLRKKSAACEVTATVVSEGCEVMRLPRRIYRATLLSAFVEEYTDFKRFFMFLPFASAFPEPSLLVLQQYITSKHIGTASVLLAENVTPREVFILLNGPVRITSSHTTEAHDVQRGDVVGGLEVLDGVLSRGAYITEGRVHVLSIPADQFLSVFRQGLIFVEHLRETIRYRQLYGSGWTYKAAHK